MSASLELQKAMVARLNADTDVTALVGTRIYDRPPPDPTFPYITFGPCQTSPNRADCYDGTTLVIQLDAWSRSVGFPEVKRIEQAVRDSLTEVELSITGYRLLDLWLEEIQTMRDPDGLTNHSAITFRVSTEPV